MAAAAVAPNNSTSTNSSSMSSDNKMETTADTEVAGDSNTAATNEETSSESEQQRPVESRPSRSKKSMSSSSSSNNHGISKKSSRSSASRTMSNSSSTNGTSTRPSSSKKPSSRRLVKKDKESSSHRNLNSNSNPKSESLPKEVNRQPQLPPQLGSINPLGTSDQEDTNTGTQGTISSDKDINGSTSHHDASSTDADQEHSEDESLRWNSLQISPNTAETSTSTSFATESSSRTILVLPSGTEGSSSSNHALLQTMGQQQSLLIADPQAMLSQLLEAMGEEGNGGETEGSLADRLGQAMNKIVQTATENGSMVFTNGNSISMSNGANTASEAGNITTIAAGAGDDGVSRLEKMEKQMEEMFQQQQQFLEFQKQTLQEKQHYQQMVQQQGDMIQQQAEVLKQQQGQIKDLMQKMEQTQTQTQLQTVVQQQQSQPQTMGTKEQTQTNSRDKEEQEMLGRLAAFDQLEASMRDTEPETQPLQQSHSQSLRQSPGGATNEDDNDHDKNNDSAIPPSGLVKVWICPSCNFEHENASLAFCGVCGEKNTGDATSRPENPNPASTRARSNSGSEPPTPELSSPIPSAQEPLIQLQLHEELLSSEAESPKEVPPKSPGRRKKITRSKSSTNVDDSGMTTPRRTRPKIPARAKTQMDEHLAQNMNNTYHGQGTLTPTRKSRRRANSGSGDDESGDEALTPSRKPRRRANSGSGDDESGDEALTPSRKPRRRANSAERMEDAGNASFTVKCLDADGDTPQQFDVEMLNQQLTTFGSAPIAAVGSAPTSSAPKTPKINKRKGFGLKGRSKSTWDVPVDTSGGPLFDNKSAARQAIPRRTKSNSTELLLMHQAQQSGDDNLVPPSPVTKNKSLFGSAVSAFHKSPKKAMDALKMAGHAKSLLKGGKGKGKNNGFLLDLEDGSDDEADYTKHNSRSDAVMGVSERQKEPTTPRTPRAQRRNSLEARAGAAGLMTKSTTTGGWNKWFNSGSKEKGKEAQEIEAPADMDIDDSVHDSDDDDDDDDEESDDRGKNRRRRRGNSAERPLSRGRSSRGMEEPNGMPRSSSHGKSNRRNRRTQSLESREKGNPNRAVPERGLQRAASTRLGEGKPARDWNRRRRNSLEMRGAGPPRDAQLQMSISQIPTDPTFKVHKDVQEKWDKQDKQEDMRNKAEQMKQRVQGLKKGKVEPVSTKPKRTETAETVEDVSDNTEGVSLYLEKSDGDISAITHDIQY